MSVFVYTRVWATISNTIKQKYIAFVICALCVSFLSSLSIQRWNISSKFLRTHFVVDVVTPSGENNKGFCFVVYNFFLDLSATLDVFIQNIGIGLVSLIPVSFTFRQI